MDTESISVLPAPAIFGLLFVGFVLVLFRPFWAFLFSVLLSVAMNNQIMVFSRLPGLGAYFNMTDGCLCICVMAVTADCVYRQRRITLPLLPLALLALLLFGYANATLTYGYAYESLRAFRWAVTIPIYYIVAANMVSSEARAKQLLLLALFGVITAELQHIYDVITKMDAVHGNLGLLRSIAFLHAHSESWLIAGPLFVAGRMRRPWLQIAAGMILLVGNVMHQTRSIAISAGCAIVFYYGWLLPGRLSERLRRFQGVMVIVALGILVAIPKIGLEGFTDHYSQRLEQTSRDDETNISRQLALEIELKDWLNGNVLYGNGLGYFYVKEFHGGRLDTDVAYGHVGYVTYLSQLGIVGLVMYGLWFPLSMLFMAKRVRRDTSYDTLTQYLAGLGGAIALFCIFCFALSGSFLGTDVLPGVLAGFLSTASTGKNAAARRTSALG